MRRRGALLIAALLSIPSLAVAAPVSSSFEVAPTMLELVPGQAGLFYLSNRGAAPVTVQIQTMDWAQNGNADVLTPSDTLYASPALATVAPGDRQTIRILATPKDASHENVYRLIASQLPESADASEGVHVLLQFSVPVFASPPSHEAPDIAWSATSDGSKATLFAYNAGSATVKLTGMTIGDQSGGPATGYFAYVLPGATHSWTVALASTLHVSAHDERSGAVIDTDIPVRR
jgi:fimbrial chaperone protein